ncbi:MAG: hypothetical protein QW057_03395 [Candidatus Bathyarchaeia archaeon]
MGITFRPEDLTRGRKRMLEQGLRDVSPGVRENVLRVLEAWEGKGSEEKLAELLGEDKARRLVKRLKPARFSASQNG